MFFVSASSASHHLCFEVAGVNGQDWNDAAWRSKREFFCMFGSWPRMCFTTFGPHILELRMAAAFWGSLEAAGAKPFLVFFIFFLGSEDICYNDIVPSSCFASVALTCFAASPSDLLRQSADRFVGEFCLNHGLRNSAESFSHVFGQVIAAWVFAGLGHCVRWTSWETNNFQFFRFSLWFSMSPLFFTFGGWSAGTSCFYYPKKGHCSVPSIRIGFTESLQWVWAPLWIGKWATAESLPIWMNLSGVLASISVQQSNHPKFRNQNLPN